jgi:hypothetical protein
MFCSKGSCVQQSFFNNVSSFAFHRWVKAGGNWGQIERNPGGSWVAAVTGTKFGCKLLQQHRIHHECLGGCSDYGDDQRRVKPNPQLNVDQERDHPHQHTFGDSARKLVLLPWWFTLSVFNRAQP